MTNVTIDGVDLNQLHYGVEPNGLNLQAAVQEDLDLSHVGLDGAIPVNGRFTSPTFSIAMWVSPLNSSGAVPAGVDPMKQLQTNRDSLMALFGRATFTITYAPPGGAFRTALCRRVATTTPEPFGNCYERIVFVCKLVNAFWSYGTSITTADFTGPSTQSMNAILAGSTATAGRVQLRVKGPITNPLFVTSNPLNTFVQLTGSLTASEYWLVDVDLFRSFKNTTGNFNVIGATNLMSATTYFNYNSTQTKMFELDPSYPNVQLFGTSGSTAVWRITGTPRYLT